MDFFGSVRVSIFLAAFAAKQRRNVALFAPCGLCVKPKPDSAVFLPQSDFINNLYIYLPFPLIRFPFHPNSLNSIAK